jgi:hypothetical protein
VSKIEPMKADAGALLSHYYRWLEEGAEDVERRRQEVKHFEELVATIATKLALDCVTSTEDVVPYVLGCFREGREGRGPLA